MSDMTLDLLGKIILEMRIEMRDLRSDLGDVRAEMRERFDALETIVNRHQDELTVTTAMVMRHASEPIAWGAMERQIKALAERMARVESRLPAE